MVANWGKSIKVTLGGALAALVIKLLSLSIRWQRPSGPQQHPKHSAIIAFWHGRMLMIPSLYHTQWRGRKNTPYMLISQHGDGRIIALAVRLLGIRSIAGSSTRGGRHALRELIRKGNQGHDLGITPDGPRGPRYQCKDGIVMVAKMTGAPVYPFCYSVNRAWQLRSWDGMIIPKPFSRGVVIVGDPVTVGRDEDTEVARVRIQEALDEVTRKADAHWATA